MFHIFEKEIVNADIHSVFDFFSKAENLEQLTPSIVGFKIVTPLPIAMQKGTLIDYKIKVHGVPIKWKTLISEWEPPYRFIDEQLKGPYLYWIHEHQFRSINENQTEIIDSVNYRPIGGKIVHYLFVKRDLDKIFSYRKKKIIEVFS
jgi:ligand-binding SRPBCC domain-containing protein